MTQNTDHQEFNLIKSEHKDLFTNQIVQSGNILSQSGLYTLLKDNPGFLQLNEKIVTSLADIFTARENNRYNNSLTWLEKTSNYSPHPSPLRNCAYIMKNSAE